MKSFKTWLPTALLTACLASRPGTAHADVTLPHIFSDHMVLQRDATVPVWGAAAPGDDVTVTMEGQTVKTQAGPDGKWRTDLKSLTAGGPFVMTVTGRNTVTFQDVLVGDVWLASGQSNMEFALSWGYKGIGPDPALQCNTPRIRQVRLDHVASETPLTDIPNQWNVAAPEIGKTFSAAAFYFARELQNHLNVPIGIIQCPWSGTPIEAWTSREASEVEPALKPLLDAHDQQLPILREKRLIDFAEAASVAPAGQTLALPADPAAKPSFCNLYNGMIAPLEPFAIKGVIWYQGENNANNAALYKIQLPLLIRDWRSHWGQGDFPFLFVQLANFGGGGNEVVNSPWAELREAQLQSLSEPKTAMATIIDIGDPNNVHPADKLDVGIRLATAARAVAYGENIEYCGPLYQSAQLNEDHITVSFTHIGTGLVVKGGGALGGFLVAGKDQKFYPATASIVGNQVVVSSPQVPEPVAVRYAWSNSPTGENLTNDTGFPASPFRTDSWDRVAYGGP